MAFNTTPFHGKLARIEKNDVAVDFTDGWSFNASVAMSATNRQGQSWTEGIPGQGSFSGSFSGHFVAGNTEQKALFDNIIAATPGTLLTDVKFLLESATSALTGDIYVTSLAVPTTVGDKVSWTINFQGNGEPDLVADA